MSLYARYKFKQRPDAVSVRGLVAAELEDRLAPGDDVVLDMFAGSGSTLVAAILCGRKAIGIEVAAEHYETALARCIAAESLWRAGLAA